MVKIFKNKTNPSRTLLPGLLMSCGFTPCAEKCKLKTLHRKLSIEEKNEYALGLSDEEVNSIFAQKELCYEKRLSDMNQW